MAEKHESSTSKYNGYTSIAHTNDGNEDNMNYENRGHVINDGNDNNMKYKTVYSQ